MDTKVCTIQRKRDGRFRDVPGLVYADRKSARSALKRIVRWKPSLKLRVSGGEK